MATIHRTYCLTLFFSLFLIQGCVNLKPVESTTRFYVLGAQDHGATLEPASRETDGISVGIRKLRLAAYLDTPYIVIRHGANQISFSENHRWGEDLKKAISRTVETYLNTQSSIRRVDAAPWPINVKHDYIVQIHVLQFEGQTDEALPEELPKRLENQEVSVHLVAIWKIIDPATNAVLHQDNTDVMLGGWNTDIYSNLVTGLDDTLETMAENIAQALESL